MAKRNDTGLTKVEAQIIADFERHYSSLPYKGATKDAIFIDWVYDRLKDVYAKTLCKYDGIHSGDCPGCGVYSDMRKKDEE